MQEYDIYLRKRLHESELFIRSLTYHDGVSATNRMVLEAMLSYYTLQRAVAAQSKTELVAEIDEIVRNIYATIGDGMEVRAKADFLARYYNEVEKDAIEIGVPALPAFLLSFFSVENALQFGVSDVSAAAKSSIGSVSDGLAITAGDVSFSKAIFETMQNAVEIGAEAGDTTKHAFETVAPALEIDAPDINIFYMYAVGAETAMSIVAAIDSSGVILKHTVGDVGNALTLTAEESGSMARKYTELSAQLDLYCRMATTAISQFEAGGSISLLASGDAGMKRYRLLSDMDGSALSDFDDMTLGDVDYLLLTV